MSDTAPLPRFLVFGEALTDFIRSGRRGCWQSVAGGACWSVARVAARLGAATAWAGSVSRDPFGAEIVAHSRVAGLDMRFIQQVDRAPLLAMVHATNPPQYFFIGNDSADLAFAAEALPAGWDEACEIAHFGSISLVRQPLGARLVALAEQLSARGTRITFDPNHRNLMTADYPALFEHMARLAHVVKLSEEDLARIYPQYPPATALNRLCELAPQATILLTRGRRGMQALADGRMIEQPAFAAHGGDEVGAGDGCMGAFVASRLQRPEAGLAAHLRFAAAAASVICSHTGAYAPSREEVSARLGGANR